MKHLLCFVILMAIGCKDSAESKILIHVTFDAQLSIDQLQMSASPESPPPQGSTRLVPEKAHQLESGLTVLVLAPEEWIAKTVFIHVDGLKMNQAVASAKGQGILEDGKTLELTVHLAHMCTDLCTPGARECVGEKVRLCQLSQNGCTEWLPPEPCPKEKPFCSKGICDVSCVDECQANERQCRDGGYVSCGHFDKDPCLDWSGIVACHKGEHCRSTDGQCVPDCGDESCSCKAGETQICSDVGECKDGIRRCKDGQLGPCEWRLGPESEICDGLDNDCNNTPDDNLISEGCENQQGVCKGAVKRCGGSSGWLSCSAEDYKKNASKKGWVFEAKETLCDSLDNDCDDQIDEPEMCCQPKCAGKACGADNGCKGICDKGSCPGPQEVCQQGKCVCLPNCAGKACGASDGCNGTCDQGSCPGPQEVCQQGKCVCLPNCAGKACGADNGCKGICLGGSCGGSGTCLNGKCTCDFTSCGNTCCNKDQVCKSGTCCSPACGNLECGPDPVCGESCGACWLNRDCISGKCVCKSDYIVCGSNCCPKYSYTCEPDFDGTLKCVYKQ